MFRTLSLYILSAFKQILTADFILWVRMIQFYCKYKNIILNNKYVKTWWLTYWFTDWLTDLLTYWLTYYGFKCLSQTITKCYKNYENIRTYPILFFCKTKWMTQNSHGDDREKNQTEIQSAYWRLLRNKGFSIMNIFRITKTFL